ncbi:hypothetical protein ACFYWH_24515 [Streptomyces sp. NPDC003737]|uniref:hypothetical protein n=1 Tax=Streptomyces sp. NPDC003737 TaxID=3364685 RepID=UPI0036917A39
MAQGQARREDDGADGVVLRDQPGDERGHRRQPDMAARDAWLARALASLGETERGAIMERLAHGDPTGDRP